MDLWALHLSILTSSAAVLDPTVVSLHYPLYKDHQHPTFLLWHCRTFPEYHPPLPGPSLTSTQAAQLLKPSGWKSILFHPRARGQFISGHFKPGLTAASASGSSVLTGAAQGPTPPSVDNRARMSEKFALLLDYLPLPRFLTRVAVAFIWPLAVREKRLHRKSCSLPRSVLRTISTCSKQSTASSHAAADTPFRQKRKMRAPRSPCLSLLISLSPGNLLSLIIWLPCSSLVSGDPPLYTPTLPLPYDDTLLLLGDDA